MATGSSNLFSQLNSYNHSADSDEESFVVLDQESLKCERGGGLESLDLAAIEESLNLVANQENEAKSMVVEKTEKSSIDDIQSRVVELLEENRQLKETLAQNNQAIKKQMEIICTWQLDSQKVHQSHKEKFAETKTYIDQLKKENVALKDKLKQAEMDLITTIEGQNLTKFELEMTQRKANQLETVSNSVQLQKQENYEIVQLKEKLFISEVENEKLLDDMIQQRTDFEQAEEGLVKEVQLLRKQVLENRKNENIQELLQNLRQQLMGAQEQITMVTNEKQTLENALKQKNHDFDDLNKKYAELSCELECIPVLKMQLDVYKNDFEAERNSAASLKAEKEKITGDLNLIQQRNQQLLVEIEALRRTLEENAVPSQSSTFSVISNHAPKEAYACPMCQFRFRNLTALENHIERCIELEALP